MTHVVTRACCGDAACVPACPVNCIHPAPGEESFASAEMVFIDPAGCIDCGACVDVCPVSAIAADFELEAGDEPYAELNRAFFAEPANADYPRTPVPRAASPVVVRDRRPLRVAVVGTGPAAAYAVDALLATPGLDIEVTVIDRLLAPGGLLRHGVAPDHQDTKTVNDQLGRLWRRPGVTLQLGVEVGSGPGADVSVATLTASHHAVVLATGAPTSRRLGVTGEHLPGCLDAARFVGWYNGHPEHAATEPYLDTQRAVVVGNGNVALDAARVLLGGAGRLGRTDIADHALAALERSSITEVEVVGRRSALHAAFTVGELYALDRLDGVEVVVDPEELPAAPAAEVADLDPTVRPLVAAKLAWLARHTAPPTAGSRILRLRFGLDPEAVVGTRRVEGLRVRRQPQGGTTLLPAGLVLTSLGFERPSGTAHERGRVTDVSGVYVVGWAKRGPRGGIGANKVCARETVEQLVADLDAGRLPDPTVPVCAYAAAPFGLEDWSRLDHHERRLGREAGRPRVKVADTVAQRAAAQGVLS